MSSEDDDLSLEQMAAEEATATSTEAIDPQQTTETVTTEETTATTEAVETSATTETAETSETEEPANRAVIDYYLSQGESWAAKYPDDTALLQAIPHLARKIGERDEDASWAKKFTPEQRAKIENLLTQQQPAAPPTSDDPEPPYQEGWEDIIRAGNPPKDIVDKLNTHRAWLGRQILKQVRNPSAAVEKIVEKIVADRLKTIEERTGELTQSIAERERQARVQSFVQQHTGDLYNERGEFTPLGKEADRLLRTDPNLVALAEVNEIAAYNNAVIMARAKVPAPKGTKPVPAAAIREPAISTGEAQTKTPEEIAMEKIDQLPDDALGTDGFAKILAELHAATA